MLVTLDNRDPGFVAQMYTIRQQGNFAGQRIVERKFLPPQGTNNHRDDRLLSPTAGNNNPRLLFRPLKYEFRYQSTNNPSSFARINSGLSCRTAAPNTTKCISLVNLSGNHPSP